uniref:AlNc14C170G7986 protein n=1 Tax=Albugo laibachii Nc14 TaxID=890382 RepID=F0WNG1_9STRA|nr:AlNc14C170G7986 [Albugo laibachii Nc14]|eukprot:CCA22852.1 AlNc14C170G7986 [Albugo laibachii Nc14]
MYNLDGPDETSIISDKASATRASTCTREESQQNQIHRKDYQRKTNDCKVEEYIAHFYRKRKILEKYLARWRQCLRDAYDRLEKANTMLKHKPNRCEETAFRQMDDATIFPLTIPYLLAIELQRQHHCLQRNPKAPLLKVSSQSINSRPYDKVDGSNAVQLSRSGWKNYIHRKVAVTEYLFRRKHKGRFKFWRKWVTGRENRMRVRKRMEQMKEKRQSFQLFNFFNDWDDYRTGKWIIGQCEAILRQQSLKRKYCSALSKWKKMLLS